MEGTNIWIFAKKDNFRSELLSKIEDSEEYDTGRISDKPADIIPAIKAGKPDIIFLDFELTGARYGVKIIQQILEQHKSAKVIILLLEEDERAIYFAICNGAYDYYLKSDTLTNIKEKLDEVIHSPTPIGAVLKNRIKKSFENVGIAQNEYNFTEREKEILNLIVGGLTKRKIAEMLALSFHTIDTHLRNIYRKLGVQSKSQAVAKVLKAHLVNT